MAFPPRLAFSTISLSSHYFLPCAQTSTALLDAFFALPAHLAAYANAASRWTTNREGFFF
jgi:hypothetical protein